MRYALLVCDDESVELGPDERSARFAAFARFAEGAAARGVLREGIRLQPTATATTVRVRGSDLVIADGPFAETKEQIAGLYIVDCADLDEAVELAARIPAAGYASIEVRPIREL